MAWTELDKISYSQLNPNLQEKINDKVDQSTFESLNQDLSNHKSDVSSHISGADREKYEYAYKEVRDILDGQFKDQIEEFYDSIREMRSHIEDNMSHWSISERNEYLNFAKSWLETIDKIQQELNEFKELSSSTYVTDESFQSLNNNFESHVIDRYIHITPQERLKWNGYENVANAYTDRAIQTHSLELDKHTEPAEKERWNQHVDSSSIHVNSTEKATYESHMNNQVIHLTSDEKSSFNTTKTDIESIKSRLNILEANYTALSRKYDEVANALHILT